MPAQPAYEYDSSLMEAAAYVAPVPVTPAAAPAAPPEDEEMFIPPPPGLVEPEAVPAAAPAPPPPLETEPSTAEPATPAPVEPKPESKTGSDFGWELDLPEDTDKES
jgi:hypothetical protein